MWRAIHDLFPSRCLKTEGVLVKDFLTSKVEKSFAVAMNAALGYTCKSEDYSIIEKSVKRENKVQMKKKCFRSLLFMIAMTSLFACSSDGPDVIEGEETTTVRVSPKGNISVGEHGSFYYDVNNVKPNRGDTLRVKLTRERCEGFYLVVEWDGVNVDTLKTFPTTYVRKMTESGNHKLVFYPRTDSQGSFASIVPRFNIDVQ